MINTTAICIGYGYDMFSKVILFHLYPSLFLLPFINHLLERSPTNEIVSGGWRGPSRHPLSVQGVATQPPDHLKGFRPP